MTTAPIHIMLDLETWGTTPGSDLRSIGACVFDPHTGYIAEPDGDQGGNFYVAVENPVIDRVRVMKSDFSDWEGFEDIRQYPLTRDPRTVQWWSEQSDEAQAAFADPVPLDQGLNMFGEWLSRVVLQTPECNITDWSRLRIWSHGANFDPGIIGAAYRAVGLPDPIHYRAPRDTRTMFDAAGMDPVTCLNDFKSADSIYHHALHDAITQARAVCHAFAVVNGWRKVSEAAFIATAPVRGVAAADPKHSPVSDLTDEQLQQAYQIVCNEWDATARNMEGRGGSPLESMAERINEIETEAKRRKVSLT